MAGHTEQQGKKCEALLSEKGINHHVYGKDEAQIGNKNAETYLSSMLQVYRGIFEVLKPSGVCALVTKNPVKNGAIRRLDLDTIRLMEAAGFALVEHVHAMLSEDLGEQGALYGEAKKIKRERKSFFKRLHERKHPDLAVNFEDVMFFQKPEAAQ